MYKEPYAYRRMTPEEREEVVRIRKEWGYPLHAPPHPIREGGCYFITCVNFEHRMIMIDDSRREEFLDNLWVCADDFDVTFIAWIILPNHYHGLVYVKQFDSISRYARSNRRLAHSLGLRQNNCTVVHHVSGIRMMMQ